MLRSMEEKIFSLVIVCIIVYMLYVLMQWLYSSVQYSVEEEKKVIKFGIVTDIHIDTSTRADLERQNAEQYLIDFCSDMNSSGADFVVVLGDAADGWIDGSTRADEQTILERIDKIKSILESNCKMKIYYVLGNHEVSTAYKSNAVARYGLPNKYYAWDYGGVRFIALDPFNYEREIDVSQDCGLPYPCQWAEFKIYDEEKIWLQQQLEDARNKGLKVVLFTHVPLSGFFEGYGTNGEYYNTIKNAGEIRDMLEQYSDVVIAVFESHYHNPDGDEISGGNHYMWKNGNVPYFGVYSLVDVDNIKSYAKVTIDLAGGKIIVDMKGAKPKYYVINI